MTIEEALSILELKPHFTTAELGKAYRHALMVWHPDRFSGNEELIKKAQERTRGIIEAFDLLSPLAAGDDDASATTKQAENDTPAREAGAQEKPRPAGAVPLPQIERLTTTGKKGRGSTDRATWIITGVSVVVAVLLITFLSKHPPTKTKSPEILSTVGGLSSGEQAAVDRNIVPEVEVVVADLPLKAVEHDIASQTTPLPTNTNPKAFLPHPQKPMKVGELMPRPQSPMRVEEKLQPLQITSEANERRVTQKNIIAVDPKATRAIASLGGGGKVIQLDDGRVFSSNYGFESRNWAVGQAVVLTYKGSLTYLLNATNGTEEYVQELHIQK